jgi:hypothetical protein
MSRVFCVPSFGALSCAPRKLSYGVRQRRACKIADHPTSCAVAVRHMEGLCTVGRNSAWQSAAARPPQLARHPEKEASMKEARAGTLCLASSRLPPRPDTLFLGVLKTHCVNRRQARGWRRKPIIGADSTGGKPAMACWRAAPQSIIPVSWPSAPRKKTFTSASATWIPSLSIPEERGLLDRQ